MFVYLVAKQIHFKKSPQGHDKLREIIKKQESTEIQPSWQNQHFVTASID